MGGGASLQPEQGYPIEVIGGAAATLLHTLQGSRPDSPDLHYQHAVRGQIGKTFSVFRLWFTRDPLSGFTLEDKDVTRTLCAVLRNQPLLRTAMLELWLLFCETFEPRLKAALVAFADGLPKFSADELVAWKNALEKLKEAEDLYSAPATEEPPEQPSGKAQKTTKRKPGRKRKNEALDDAVAAEWATDQYWNRFDMAKRSEKLQPLLAIIPREKREQAIRLSMNRNRRNRAKHKPRAASRDL